MFESNVTYRFHLKIRIDRGTFMQNLINYLNQK